MTKDYLWENDPTLVPKTPEHKAAVKSVLGNLKTHAKKADFATVLKANPYRDRDGKFTSKDKAANGADFQEKLRDHSEQELAKLTDEQTAAIQQYTSEAYDDINHVMRYEEDAQGPFTYEWIDAMTDAFDAVEGLPEEMTVYRGMGATSRIAKKLTEAFDSGEALVGQSIQDQGFMSTTINEGMAKDWAHKDGGVVLNIKAPKGSKGLYVSSISAWNSEKEILFQQQSRMVITGAKKIKHRRNEKDIEILELMAEMKDFDPPKRYI